MRPCQKCQHMHGCMPCPHGLRPMGCKARQRRSTPKHLRTESTHLPEGHTRVDGPKTSPCTGCALPAGPAGGTTRVATASPACRGPSKMAIARDSWHTGAQAAAPDAAAAAAPADVLALEEAIRLLCRQGKGVGSREAGVRQRRKSTECRHSTASVEVAPERAGHAHSPSCPCFQS